MYLVNWVVGADKRPALFAHRLNLKTGAEIGKPVAITGALKDAQGQPAVDKQGNPVVLHKDQKQRPALLLSPLHGLHKTLFIATTRGENPGAPHGWIVAIDVDFFAQTASWVSTPSSFGGGIWQASQSLAAEDQGNVYAITGNGGYIKDDKGHATDFKRRYRLRGGDRQAGVCEDWRGQSQITLKQNSPSTSVRSQPGANLPVRPF